MPITVQDAMDFANDLVQNYTTGAVDLGNRMRAANRSYEWLQAKLTLPSDKTIYKFYFSQDQQFYDMPVGFNEPLLLYYNTTSNNKPVNNWKYRPDTEIIERMGQNTSTNKYFGTTTINGKSQIVSLGMNLNQGSIIATLDSTIGVTVSGDATNLSTDTIVRYEGTGSAKFNIAPSSGTATITVVPKVTDWRNWHTNQAFLKLRVFMPSVAFSSINLRAGSDVSNYYTFTATTQDDGTAFTPNTWNLISWKFPNNPIVTGSPNDAAISFCSFDFVESGFGVSTVQNFRIDDFYSTMPDYLNLVYLTYFKGTTSGGTQIQNFTVGTDIPSFSTIAPDLLSPWAYRMAYILHPQLRKEPEFWSMYKTECDDQVKIYGRIYPRQRIITYGKTHLERM